MTETPGPRPDPGLLDTLLAQVAAAGDAPGAEFDAGVLEQMQRYRLAQGTAQLAPAEIADMAEILRRLIARHGPAHTQVPAQPQRYIASYPRSGNTMTLGMLRQLTPVLTTSDMRHSKRYTLPALERPGFPALRLCKTHQVPEWRAENRYVFVFRDPRDLLPSLAYMTLQSGQHRFTERHQMADFIAFLHDRYPFGGWVDFARAALALQGRENVLILQYDALNSDWRALAQAARFLGVQASEDRMQAAFAARGQTLDKMRTKSNWGLEAATPPGSLYEAWMAARGGSNWHQTLDAAARDALKSRGYTPLLIALGYAVDDAW
jgi:hypothetical protein